MRIPQLRVETERSIRFAEVEKAPPLTIIAGPNGAGKSTFLNAIRRSYTSDTVLYVGPHRAARRQVVREATLIGRPISLAQIHSQHELSGIDGVPLTTGAREPWGADESGNFLKHGMCQIAIREREAIANRYYADREIPKNSLPDPWAPLRELTSNLLPHLTFERIDSNNRDAIRVLWKVSRREVLVDLDDLSSGEKAVIQLFYPLVETRMTAILDRMAGRAPASASGEICMLIDEPELHLHPNLQVKVVDYLRRLSVGGQIQIVIATQSSTIVEAASYEELYLLRPADEVKEGTNQITQVATTEERLEALRELFGTTSNITALQPVVVVEGVGDSPSSKTVSDRRLYRALHPGFDRVTIVPGGGKSECYKLRSSLDEALKSFSQTAGAIALLDQDTGGGTQQAGVFLLPVSMIENFLLDPETLWAALNALGIAGSFTSADDIAKGLDAVLDDIEAAEVDRRAISRLGTFYFRPSAPTSGISSQVSQKRDELESRYGQAEVAKAVADASTIVAAIKGMTKRREAFHGKYVLNAFRTRYLAVPGIPEGTLKLEVAMRARDRRSVGGFFNSFFKDALPSVGAPWIPEKAKAPAPEAMA
jgi:predicted ATPase